ARTGCPAATSRRTTAVPSCPVAPTTRIMARSRFGSNAAHGPAKIDDPLGFLESQPQMCCMRAGILDGRIGRELAAAMRKRPALDFGDEHACHTFAPLGRNNVQPLQESDRRSARAVDIVDAPRRLD